MFHQYFEQLVVSLSDIKDDSFEYYGYNHKDSIVNGYDSK